MKEFEEFATRQVTSAFRYLSIIAFSSQLSPSARYRIKKAINRIIMSSGNEQLIDQLKEIRTSAEAHVSEKVNKLNELMAACENIDALKDVQKELKEVLKEFEIAHEAYHRLIKNETEQEESTRYYNSVLEIVTDLRRKLVRGSLDPQVHWRTVRTTMFAPKIP